MLLQEKLIKNKLLLASKSPRRRELLAGLDIPFQTIDLNVEESYPKDLKGTAITEFLAQKKANGYKNLQPGDILLTADTIVWLNDQALEKPNDRVEAQVMLAKLSGNSHEVITSVCLKSLIKEVTFTDVTKVFFTPLTPEEIAYYVSKYPPLDKSGSYGIQEWIGYMGVDRIEGSQFNVMGLPVQKLYKQLMIF